MQHKAVVKTGIGPEHGRRHLETFRFKPSVASGTAPAEIVSAPLTRDSAATAGFRQFAPERSSHRKPHECPQSEIDLQ